MHRLILCNCSLLPETFCASHIGKCKHYFCVTGSSPHMKVISCKRFPWYAHCLTDICKNEKSNYVHVVSLVQCFRRTYCSICMLTELVQVDAEVMQWKKICLLCSTLLGICAARCSLEKIVLLPWSNTAVPQYQHPHAVGVFYATIHLPVFVLFSLLPFVEALKILFLEFSTPIACDKPHPPLHLL